MQSDKDSRILDAEGEVRRTAFRLMRDLLRSSVDLDLPPQSIDLQGAVLDGADFSGCPLGKLTMGRTFIAGDLNLNDCLFGGEISLGDDTTIKGNIELGSSQPIPGDVAVGSRCQIDGNVELQAKTILKGQFVVGQGSRIGGHVRGGSDLTIEGIFQLQAESRVREIRLERSSSLLSGLVVAEGGAVEQTLRIEPSSHIKNIDLRAGSRIGGSLVIAGPATVSGGLRIGEAAEIGAGVQLGEGTVGDGIVLGPGSRVSSLSLVATRVTAYVIVRPGATLGHLHLSSSASVSRGILLGRGAEISDDIGIYDLSRVGSRKSEGQKGSSGFSLKAGIFAFDGIHLEEDSRVGGSIKLWGGAAVQGDLVFKRGVQLAEILDMEEGSRVTGEVTLEAGAQVKGGVHTPWAEPTVAPITARELAHGNKLHLVLAHGSHLHFLIRSESSYMMAVLPEDSVTQWVDEPYTLFWKRSDDVR
ncbi:hypothetical protein GCM10009528_30300 [Kineococcus aurantiacus]